MNILIVDGNEKEASDRYTALGMETQFENYKNVLTNLSPNKLNISIVHPSVKDIYLPQGISLDDFDGVVWTGSLLNIYDMTPSIVNQIELAKTLFAKKNKIFGSCWGLQILATAAGGKVRKNPKGLEAVIAKDISINKKGLSHPMYESKPKKFDSFCWHYDELETLPPNTEVYASNNISNVQSLSFFKDSSEIWAVQYHPEFNPKWISGLMSQRKSKLLEEGVYKNSSEFNSMFLYLSDIKKFDYLKLDLSISQTLVNQKVHTIELFNWLKHLRKSI
tara:strand:- start:190 stop:1020 length:831 start_codon:yes stop_codon:yes gene_type:complete